MGALVVSVLAAVKEGGVNLVLSETPQIGDNIVNDPVPFFRGILICTPLVACTARYCYRIKRVDARVEQGI